MTTTRARLIKLNNNDNVAVASSEISSGAIITPQSLTALNEIPAGHKIALSFIPKDQPIIKYNQIIGFANSDITPGSHVHTHNVYVEGFKRDHAISQDLKQALGYHIQARESDEAAEGIASHYDQREPKWILEKV